MNCPICSRECINADMDLKEFGLRILEIANPIGLVKSLGMVANAVYNEFSDGIPFEDYEVKFCSTCKMHFVKCPCTQIISLGVRFPKVGKRYKCPKCNEFNYYHLHDDTYHISP